MPTASAVTLNVPGTSDPWLAGQPNGTAASWGDVAPDQSPVFAGNVTPGDTITWAATGHVAFGPGINEFGPNGDLGTLTYGYVNHFLTGSPSPENGISDALNIPIDSLMGVFLGPGVPVSGAEPAALDFSALGLLSGTLAPLVNQVFYMGDGSAQSATVPAGASRLFLGVMDGFGWFNNTGSHTVTLDHVSTPVPDGGSTLGMLVATCGLAEIGRRKLGRS